MAHASSHGVVLSKIEENQLIIPLLNDEKFHEAVAYDCSVGCISYKSMS